MREIKFRVWGKQWGDKGETMFNLPFGEDMYFYEEEMYNKFPEDWVIMQYTGLKDKNGIEIYEGDIIPVDDKNYEVRFNNVYCRYSLWSEKYSAGVYKHLLCNGLPRPLEFPAMGDINTRHLEVIGNIYENSELLK